MDKVISFQEVIFNGLAQTVGQAFQADTLQHIFAKRGAVDADSFKRFMLAKYERLKQWSIIRYSRSKPETYNRELLN